MVWKILGPLGEEIGTIVKEAPGIGLLAIPLLIIGWGLLGFLGPFCIIKKHPVIASIMLVTSFGGWISCMIIACMTTAHGPADPTLLFKIIVVILGVSVLLVNPILVCALLKD